MKQQQGATLITVLIILVLVTVLGTIAVKTGILGLKIATNSQVNALLLENSDAALFNVENPDDVARQLALDGMFAYFNSAANADDELVFCYRASESSFFSLNKASAITNNGATTTTAPSLSSIPTRLSQNPTGKPKTCLLCAKRLPPIYKTTLTNLINLTNLANSR